MSHIRYNHVFLTLLLLGALCAFIVPIEYSNRLRGNLDILFAPVASPVRYTAELLTARLRPNSSRAFDLKTASPDAQVEIARLRAAVAALTTQNAELLRQQKNYQLKGDVQAYSVPCRVVGADPARDSLSLAATRSDGLAVGMPVVWRDFIVGRVVAAGPGGSLVRLVTDRGFRANAAFGRFNGPNFVTISTKTPLVEGRGNSLMSINNVTVEEARKIQPGDWVVLQDSEDWPLILNGYQIGYVEQIEPQPKSQLWAQITVRPAGPLLQLREAMVVTRTPASARAKPPATPPAKTPQPPTAKTDQKGTRKTP